MFGGASPIGLEVSTMIYWSGGNMEDEQIFSASDIHAVSCCILINQYPPVSNPHCLVPPNAKHLASFSHRTGWAPSLGVQKPYEHSWSKEPISTRRERCRKRKGKLRSFMMRNLHLNVNHCSKTRTIHINQYVRQTCWRSPGPLGRNGNMAHGCLRGALLRTSHGLVTSLLDLWWMARPCPRPSSRKGHCLKVDLLISTLSRDYLHVGLSIFFWLLLISLFSGSHFEISCCGWANECPPDWWPWAMVAATSRVCGLCTWQCSLINRGQCRPASIVRRSCYC